MAPTDEAILARLAELEALLVEDGAGEPAAPDAAHRDAATSDGPERPMFRLPSPSLA